MKASAQKIGLVFFGLFFSFVLVESGMRVASFVLSNAQEGRNINSMRQGGKYTILCLGESTTAGFGENAYPFFLEQFLNKKNVCGRVVVINKGVTGTHCAAILSELERNLNCYKPEMVIAMMGINEGNVHMPKEIPSTAPYVFLKKFKTFKLFQYIALHFQSKMKTYKSKNIEMRQNLINGGFRNPDPPLEGDEYLRAGWNFQEMGDFQRAEDSFLNALMHNPRNYHAYRALGSLYSSIPDYERAVQMFEEALEIRPDDSNALTGAGWAYIDMWEAPNFNERIQKARMMFEKAIASDALEIQAYFGLERVYRNLADFSRAQQVLLKILAIDPESELAYRALVGLCHENGKEELADYYLRQYSNAEEIGDPHLGKYFKDMFHMLSGKKIQLVCVQYPTLKVDPLKSYFGHEAKDIIFIENRDNFLRALKGRKYNELFTDMFAGTFGHCTVEGNQLLATNIADILYRKVFRGGHCTDGSQRKTR